MNIQITKQVETTHFELIEGINVYVIKHECDPNNVFDDHWSARINNEEEITNAKLLRRLTDACKIHQMKVWLQK